MHGSFVGGRLCVCVCAVVFPPVDIYRLVLMGREACTCCFSISVIKYHEKSNLQKEEFILSCSSRGIRVRHGVEE